MILQGRTGDNPLPWFSNGEYDDFPAITGVVLLQKLPASRDCGWPGAIAKAEKNGSSPVVASYGRSLRQQNIAEAVPALPSLVRPSSGSRSDPALLASMPGLAGQPGPLLVVEKRRADRRTVAAGDWPIAAREADSPKGRRCFVMFKGTPLQWMDPRLRRVARAPSKPATTKFLANAGQKLVRAL